LSDHILDVGSILTQLVNPNVKGPMSITRLSQTHSWNSNARPCPMEIKLQGLDWMSMQNVQG